ncbi:MAG TPA: OmpA family protein [Acidimicrobiia bacterium]
MAKTSKKMSSRLQELDKFGSKAGGAPPMSRVEAEPPLDAPIFILTAFLPLVILVGAAVFFGTRNIESTLASQATALFAAAEVEGLEVDVEAHGLALTISGIVPREDLLTSIPAFVQENIAGIRSIETDLRFVAPVVPGDIVVSSDPLIVTWEGSSGIVTGTLSDDATVTFVVDTLSGIFGTLDSTGLVVKPGVGPERDWLGTILTVVREMDGRTASGEVLANPDAGLVRVGAEFDTRQERGEAVTDVEEILSALTFDFVDSLTVKDTEVPPPTQEEVVELQTNLDELIEGKVVEFGVDSDVITPRGQDLLDEILDALQQVPNVPVQISGHTDDNGTDEHNLDLSRRRAEAVLDYLVAHGEDPERFVVIGYGESRPVADNGTPEGEARNRRIEFTALEE